VSAGAGRVERIERHKDGSVRARGHEVDGQLDGYWEWFRADGTRLRSGSFSAGVQVGEWTTYDRDGNPYKVTDHGPGPAAAG
jgi:antitoxin component YwqK of YwqJK toxin-antitoxin module